MKVLVSEAAQEATERVTASAWGQGFSSSPERNKAIEMQAMAAATAYFEDRCYTVKDTSKHKPYDLVARKEGGLVYVEVKGTTGGGEQVNVTRGEVEHARAHRDQTVLFVLHGVEVEDGEDGPVATGGTKKVLWPWDVDAGELVPISFTHRLPARS